MKSHFTNTSEHNRCFQQRWHTPAIGPTPSSRTGECLQGSNHSWVGGWCGSSSTSASPVTFHPFLARSLHRTHTQKLFSFGRLAASSRSLGPIGRLCCPTPSPPRTPEAPAAAPSPSLLTRLSVRGKDDSGRCDESTWETTFSFGINRNSERANRQQRWRCPSCPAPAAPSLSSGLPGWWPSRRKRRSQTQKLRDLSTSPPLPPEVAGRHTDRKDIQRYISVQVTVSRWDQDMHTHHTSSF